MLVSGPVAFSVDAVFTGKLKHEGVQMSVFCGGVKKMLLLVASGHRAFAVV